MSQVLIANENYNVERHVPAAGRLTLRRAETSDACAIAALFQAMYKDSSHPFRSLAQVSEFLEDTRNFLIMAEEDNRLVACMAMTYNSWNDSYELGRAITVAEYRRNGLAALLMQRVVDMVSNEQLGELTHGFARVRRIADLTAALDPQLVVVGHDGGRNIANGSRETHLICCGKPRHARFTHVRPSVAELTDWRFVRDIYSTLDLHGSAGEYPQESFVGSFPLDALVEGPWALTYESQSGSLEIIARADDSATPSQVSEELSRIIDATPGVQHVTVTILADKVELIRALAASGFEMSAYLPAWHKDGSYRYDCIQMIRRLYDAAPATPDFADWLQGLETEFSSAPILN